MKPNTSARINPLHLPFLEKLGKYSRYSNGWYLNDSLAPTYTAVNSAMTFIKLFDFTIYEQPFLGLAEDGEINFHWNTDYIDIDLGFFGDNPKDNTYSYYAKTKDPNNVKEWCAGEIPSHLPLDDDILYWLKLEHSK